MSKYKIFLVASDNELITDPADHARQHHPKYCKYNKSRNGCYGRLYHEDDHRHKWHLDVDNIYVACVVIVHSFLLRTPV